MWHSSIRMLASGRSLLGAVRAGGGGLPGLGEDQGADQAGGLLPEDAFRDPHQQHPAVVEHGGEVDGGGSAAQQLPGERAQQQRAQLVQQRCGHLRPRGVGQGGEPAPVAGQLGVDLPGGACLRVRCRAEVGGGAGERVGVGEQFGDHRQRWGFGAGAQGQTRHPQQVVGAETPRGGEQPGEHGDHVLHRRVPHSRTGGHAGVGGVGGQRVQTRPHRPPTGRVRPPARWAAGWSGSIRIMRRRARSGRWVVMSTTRSPLGSMTSSPRPAAASSQDQMGHQGGLSGAGRADDLQVMAGVGHRHADRAARGGVAVAQRFHPRPGCRCLWGWRDGGGPGAQEPGYVLVDGEVGQRRQLRHRQHVTAAQPACGDRGGRVGAGDGGGSGCVRRTRRTPRPPHARDPRPPPAPDPPLELGPAPGPRQCAVALADRRQLRRRSIVGLGSCCGR